MVNGYTNCGKKCDACEDFVENTSYIKSFATGRKFNIRNSVNCTTLNVIYVAFCMKCGKQGVGSTIKWKSRLANYKSHIKKKIRSCVIVNHFIDECYNDENPTKYIRFALVDSVNNTYEMSTEKVDELLLFKENVWNGSLVTQHKGLNGTHDWCRKKRRD